MFFPNAFVRFFVLIWLGGWLLALGLAGWMVWKESREQKRLPPFRESLAVLVGLLFSWPVVVPFGFWLRFGSRRIPQQTTLGKLPGPWWVWGTTALVLAVLIGLVAASMISGRGR